MTEISETELTRTWVCMMLYRKSMSSTNLIREGCKSMVYGWTYEEFMSILSRMDEEDIIYATEDKENGGTYYELTDKGLFEVKRKSIVPLLNISEREDYLNFLDSNRAVCDMSFIESLQDKEDDTKINIIVNYAKNNLKDLVNILALANSFLASVKA